MSLPRSTVGQTIHIARCPEHGLHGERKECFVCGGAVEQVAMVPAFYRDWWEDAARTALHWKHRADELEEAIEEYALWQPGRRGHAAAHKRLMAVLHGEEPDDE
jgi:hypothetical protein